MSRERADHVPGIRVVGALEKHKVPWAILTNGKDWRLYCAAAHSRASNYYEVELPEALARDDLVALRYFWLFFRAASFVPRSPAAGEPSCFLDQVRLDSQAFAKEVGDRLRGRIFDEVFPFLAEGFVQYRRSHFDEKTVADDEFLGQVYDATLTLLYRLLFLLYAESLDLLPVHEPGYAAVGLTRLKQEVAEAAGEDSDAVNDFLKRRYTKSDTDLWQRLSKLFQVIAEGSREHNVPAYNGGLFSMTPDRDDHSCEAKAARFLKKYRVSDFFLARALDLLARDEDPKNHELVFVDYRSLGVRELGTIYEGLLMYHVVVPCDDWERGFRRPNLRIALVPSNQQRKSSGSYFTPQHIVKHIVTNTVGPLLDEKFAALAPKLREAQRWFADKRKFEDKKAEKLRSPSPTDGQIARWMLDRFEPVVWDLLDLKVLDPAMGSAHFLVETVDYITDRVLDFLSGFPTNPVQVVVDQRIRRQILDALDQQEVKINEERLTDVNLIKRLVMKHCVYGVDLNPMAVELAKVSLWLDSFTLGAPLSFLDHHLKCGNSLIGATIEDLKRAARGWVFGIAMEPLQRATRNMELIADLTDATLTEVSRSADIYKEVLSGVRGYRALLDCLTAEHFGVPGASELISHGSDLDLEHWGATVKGLPAKDRRWIEQAEQISRERGFFHWDVDFPDVFFTSRRPEELRRFDAVVGNPPYDELSEYAAGEELPEKEFLEETAVYAPAKGGRQNVFRYFIVRAATLLRANGSHSFIVPMALLTDQFTLPLRRWLLSNYGFVSIDQFPQKDDPTRRVFVEAKLSTCIYSIRASAPSTERDLTVRTNPANVIDPGATKFDAAQSDFSRLDPQNWSIPSYSCLEWEVIKKLATNHRVFPASSVLNAYPGEVMLNAQFEQYLADHGQVLLRGAAHWEIRVSPATQAGRTSLPECSEIQTRKTRRRKGWAPSATTSWLPAGKCHRQLPASHRLLDRTLRSSAPTPLAISLIPKLTYTPYSRGSTAHSASGVLAGRARIIMSMDTRSRHFLSRSLTLSRAAECQSVRLCCRTRRAASTDFFSNPMARESWNPTSWSRLRVLHNKLRLGPRSRMMVLLSLVRNCVSSERTRKTPNFHSSPILEIMLISLMWTNGPGQRNSVTLTISAGKAVFQTGDRTSGRRRRDAGIPTAYPRRWKATGRVRSRGN